MVGRRRHLPATGLTALDAGSEFWDAERARRELSAAGYFGDAGWPPALTAAADGDGREPCLSAVGGCVTRRARGGRAGQIAAGA